MRRVEPFPLWLGNVGDLQSPDKLYDAQIRAVVDLAANEPFPHLPRDFIFIRVPLYDGAGNEPFLLRLAIQTVSRLLAEGVPTLVCCSNGLSRAPAISAGALAGIESLSIEDALRRVSIEGKHDVLPGLWGEVCATVAAAERSV
jgi:protein-tyrosine phosphatase